MASRFLQAPLEAQIRTAVVQPIPQQRPGLDQGFMAELQGFAAVLSAGAGDQAHGRAGKALNHAPRRRRILAVGDHLMQTHTASGVAAAFAQLYQIEKQAPGDALVFFREASQDAVGLLRQGASHPADLAQGCGCRLPPQQALPDAQQGELQQWQGAIAAQALLHQQVHGGGIQWPAAPLGRQADGVLQALLGEGRHKHALGLDELVEGRIGLGGAEKIAAKGHQHRHLAGAIRRRPQQVGQERLAYGGIRAEAVELLQLINHHYQRPHIGLGQQGGDALKPVVLSGAIGQGQLLGELAGFAHRSRVVRGDAGQHAGQRLQRLAARYQQRNPRLGPAPRGPARQLRHQPRPHQRRLARTGGAVDH